jgi:hypothetical protein
VVSPTPRNRRFVSSPAKLETTVAGLETGEPDLGEQLAELVLEYAQQPLPPMASRLTLRMLQHRQAQGEGIRRGEFMSEASLASIERTLLYWFTDRSCLPSPW